MNSSASNPPQKLNCPTCSKTISWSDEFPHRPFCNQRCQQIDLGDWASEENRIAGSSIYDDLLSEQLENQQS